MRLSLLMVLLAHVLAGCPARSGFDAGSLDLELTGDSTNQGDHDDDSSSDAGDVVANGDSGVVVRQDFRMAYDRTWVILQLDQPMAPLLPAGTQGAIYSVKPPLPTGLTLDVNDGTIAGTPTAPVAPFTIYEISAFGATTTAVTTLRIAVVSGFVVDSTSDLAATGTLGDGVCAPPGQCSIRAALAEVNALAGVQGVFVPSGLYVIDSTMVLHGDALVGARSATIRPIIDSSGAAFSLFTVGVSESPLLTDLEVTEGTLTQGSGGCFAISGTATMSHLSIHDCQAQRGAGIAVFGSGQLLMEASQMADNSVGGGGAGGGGAIATDESATLELATSSFTDNLAGQGAAIDVGGSSATIDRCYFGDNSSQQGGGAVFVGAASTANIASSTFENNISTTSAGGALLTRGVLSVVYSTFDDNVCSGTGQVISVQGGTASMRGTLMFSQTAPCDVDDFGFTSLGYNVYDGAFAACPDLSAPTDVTSANLGSFSGIAAANGGPTLTVAIDPGGAAHDVGDLDCPAFDQRGEPKPYNGFGSLSCDAGAYEAGIHAP